MRLKNWPYWLKGGIISLIAFFSLLLLNYFISFIFTNTEKIKGAFTYVVLIPSWVVVMPVIKLFCRSSEAEGCGSFFFILILSPILWFLIGVFVGWFIGKIKSKK